LYRIPDDLIILDPFYALHMMAYLPLKALHLSGSVIGQIERAKKNIFETRNMDS